LRGDCARIGEFRPAPGLHEGRFPLVEKEIVSAEKDKPVLDEHTLGKLLEAAYVLQEHNRELQQMELGLSLKREQIEAEERSAPAEGAPRRQDTDSAADSDYTFTLAKIVETQHQIQVRHLEFESAMSMVAERLVLIARASGASIGILDDKKLRYRAAAGLMSLPAGTDVPMEKALCLACLRTGQVFRCADVNPEFLLDTEECRRRGIQSMIAVPIFHDGGVAGGLELYYPTTQAFTEQDVHTCQLMAGLVTEALARDEEATWKKSLATERAVMLEALEKLKPNLAALVDKPAAKDSTPRAGTASVSSTAAASPSTFLCRKCGHALVGEEQFCGNCGTPRSSDYEPPSMQSKVASLWHMQEALKKNSPSEPATVPGHQESRADVGHAHPEKSLADSLEEQMPELFTATHRTGYQKTESTELDESWDQTPGQKSERARNHETDRKPEQETIGAEFEDSVLSDLEVPLNDDPAHALQTPSSTALAKTDRATAWSSAASARDFLEQLARSETPGGVLARFWNTRRGDIYLAIAVLLVAAVIGWGIFSNHSVGATGSSTSAVAGHHKAPDADLSLFDRMLISLGLAEAPPQPEYKGNPDTQVWVDLHTALYYCPGADLYGKTPKGKMTSQRDAQLDQFEPAYRKTCD
jgi:GAF domain-containing protein